MAGRSRDKAGIIFADGGRHEAGGFPDTSRHLGAGKGHGRWLMANALALGWARPITRMWVHTCTLDHPSALNFYRAQGFQPFARAVETFADPRLLGAQRTLLVAELALLLPKRALAPASPARKACSPAALVRP